MHMFVGSTTHEASLRTTVSCGNLPVLKRLDMDQVHDSTFTNPLMSGAVAVTHVAADDAIGRATDRVQNW
jgi:hypothetical protein